MPVYVLNHPDYYKDIKGFVKEILDGVETYEQLIRKVNELEDNRIIDYERDDVKKILTLRIGKKHRGHTSGYKLRFIEYGDKNKIKKELAEALESIEEWAKDNEKFVITQFSGSGTLCSKLKEYAKGDIIDRDDVLYIFGTFINIWNRVIDRYFKRPKFGFEEVYENYWWYVTDALHIEGFGSEIEIEKLGSRYNLQQIEDQD